MTNRTIIEVALAAEDMAWLGARAEYLDLDIHHVLRSLVRQARMNESRALQGAAMPTADGKAEWARLEREAAERKRQAEIAAKRAELERQLAELNGDPEPLGYDHDADVTEALHEADEVLDLPRVSLSGPPGSLFVPTGVSANVPRGYDKTDPRGSVARQNYAYLGFNGG